MGLILAAVLFGGLYLYDRYDWYKGTGEPEKANRIIMWIVIVIVLFVIIAKVVYPNG